VKYKLIKSLGMLMAMAIISFSCTGTIEQDAKQLALLQKERTETIKLMLQIDDSLQLTECRKNLLVITTKYKSRENLMKTKYNNDKEWARFEEAYGKALEFP
jgi:hypothetical protein